MVLAQSTKTSQISHCLTEGKALSLVLILPFYFQQSCFLFYPTLSNKSKLSSRAREIKGYPQFLHHFIRSHKSPPSIGLSQGPLIPSLDSGGSDSLHSGRVQPSRDSLISDIPFLSHPHPHQFPVLETLPCKNFYHTMSTSKENRQN